MTPEALQDRIAEIMDANPLPQPSVQEVGKVLTTRRNLLETDINGMDLDELREIVDDVIIWAKLPTWVTRLIACELIIRLERVEEEGRDAAFEQDLADL